MVRGDILSLIRPFSVGRRIWISTWLPLPSFDLLQLADSAGALEELLSGTYARRQSSIPFFAIAGGIDLSDLGFAEGTEVSELFFQDAADDLEHQVDPVFIGGLPPLSQSRE